jgi:hypothetical protein
MGQFYSIPDALHETNKCDKCLIPSYKEYIEKFKEKYSKDLENIKKMDKEFLEYEKIHKIVFPTEKQSDAKIKLYNKANILRKNILIKIITNKEYLDMTNTYLQCSKSKCKQYYKQYIEIVKNTLHVIFRELFATKQLNKKLPLLTTKYYNSIIHFAKQIGIDTEQLNKKAIDEAIFLKNKFENDIKMYQQDPSYSPKNKTKKKR